MCLPLLSFLHHYRFGSRIAEPSGGKGNATNWTSSRTLVSTIFRALCSPLMMDYIRATRTATGPLRLNPQRRWVRRGSPGRWIPSTRSPWPVNRCALTRRLVWRRHSHPQRQWTASGHNWTLWTTRQRPQQLEPRRAARTLPHQEPRTSIESHVPTA